MEPGEVVPFKMGLHGKRCAVCVYERRTELESDMVLGLSTAELRKRWPGVREEDMSWHRRHHLPGTLRAACMLASAEARGAVSMESAAQLAGEVVRLRGDADAIAQRFRDGDVVPARVALRAIESQARLIELQGRLLGLLSSGTEVTLISSHPDYVRIRALLVDVVSKCDTCAPLVVGELLAIEQVGRESPTHRSEALRRELARPLDVFEDEDGEGGEAVGVGG
jgi:hypothetical protein